MPCRTNFLSELAPDLKNVRDKSWIFGTISFSYWTKMYPIALMCVSPKDIKASFPQELLLTSIDDSAPKPILESQEEQLSSLLLRIPILTFGHFVSIFSVTTLNPSLLQLGCKKAWEPISSFHVSRPSEVLWCFPSAISECRELACLLITVKLIWCPIFIPRQILVKGVPQ